MINFTGTVTGATVTGLTSPTYTLSGAAFQGNLLTAYVSAVGGTQTGVLPHSISSPFRVEFASPAKLSQPGAVSPMSGRIQKVPKNVFRLSFYKGAVPLSGQPADSITASTDFRIPAGVDTADPNQIRALISCIAGWWAVQANRDGLIETLISGIK